MTKAEVQTLLGQSNCIASCMTPKAMLASRASIIFETPVTPPGPPEPALPTTDAQLQGWWRSDTGLTLDGANVADGSDVWLDLSPAARHFTVPAGAGPAYSASATPSGKPAIVYTEGGTKRMTTSNDLTLVQPISIFLLVKTTSWAENKYYFDSVSASGRCSMLQHSAEPLFVGYSTGYGQPFGLPVGEWRVVTFIINAASSIFTADDFLPVSGQGNGTAVGSFDPRGIFLGNSNQGAFNFNPGAEFAAIILVNGVADASQRTLHTNWLKWYGGITYRVPDATPLDTSRIFGWFSTDSGLTNNGGVCYGTNCWLDQSGLARHANQAVLGSGPLVDTAYVNGHDALRFTGSGATKKKLVLGGGDLNVTTSPGWAMFLLIKMISLDAGKYIWDTDGGNKGAGFQPVAGSLQILATSLGPTATGLGTSSWQVVYVYFGGGNCELQIDNGTLQTGSDGGGPYGNNLVLGTYALDDTYGSNFRCAAVVLMIGKPTAAEKTLIKNYLNAYAGI